MSVARTAGLALLLLAPGATGAQAQTSRSDPSDLQTWYSAALHVNLPARWETSLRYRLKLVDDASTYRGSYLTAEAGRGLTGWLTLFGSYRLALVDEGTFHRFAGGAEAKAKLEAVTLAFRSMLQYQRQNFAGNDEQSSDESVFLRTRMEAKYGVTKRLDLYASSEPIFELADGIAVDNWRNELGLKYEYLKGARLGLFYIYRPDYAKSYDRTFHVIGVDLDFDVKVPGRKAPSAP